MKKSEGGAQPNISKEKIVATLIPLPPLAEQKRIVAKLDELLPYVDRYAAAYDKLTALDKDFPDQLKKSLLQRAIEGKLVPQIEAEGTVEELYKEIQAEKAKLIKEKKIKKEKPLPEITEDEVPFEIPSNWKWVRLGEIGVMIRGSGIKRDETVDKGLPCVRYGEIYTSYQTKFTRTKSFVPLEIFSKCKKMKNKDVMFTLTGENKPDIAKAVAYLGDGELAVGGDMAYITNHCCDALYLTYLLNGPEIIKQKIALATGDIIVHISVDKMRGLLIPLPPLAEQKRIVARLDELLPLCDELGKKELE